MRGDVIAVSLPGTAYRAFFRRVRDKQRLSQDPQLSVDKGAPMSHQDFEAMAWKAATNKARELGWIA